LFAFLLSVLFVLEPPLQVCLRAYSDCPFILILSVILTTFRAVVSFITELSALHSADPAVSLLHLLFWVCSFSTRAWRRGDGSVNADSRVMVRYGAARGLRQVLGGAIVG
jgi:hypothetical protein